MMITLETLVPATGMFSYAWLMIAVPAIVAACLLLGGTLLDKSGHLFAVVAVLFSFSDRPVQEALDLFREQAG